MSQQEYDVSNADSIITSIRVFPAHLTKVIEQYIDSGWSKVGSYKEQTVEETREYVVLLKIYDSDSRKTIKPQHNS
jgi:hypothetical protein